MKLARSFAAVLLTSALSVVTAAVPTSATSETDVVRTQAVVPQSVSVADGLPASELATGSRLACALTTQADGRKVYCWGSTYYGAVGNGVAASGQVNYPNLVVDGSDGFVNSGVSAIDAGGGNACAIKDGSVYCWGLNESGQLGDGLTATKSEPVKVGAGVSGATPLFVNSDVTRIAVGSGVICAVRTIPGSGSGTGDHLYCWGMNNQGQLGTLESSTTTTCLMMSQSFKCEKKPVLVTATADLPNNGTEAITDVSIGSGTGCAISGGQVVCWGIQNRGNLGRAGTSDSTSYLAGAVTASDGFANTTGVTAVSIGRESVCAIEAQQVYCWGSNDLGTVGIGTSSNSETSPKKVLDNSVSGFVNASVSDVDVESGQGETACAVASGVAYCWGSDGVDSTFTSILSVSGPDTCGSDQCALKPVKVSDGEMNNTGVTAVKVGPEFVCAIKSNVPFCWGSEGEGQLGLSGYSPRQNATPPEYYQNPWMVYKTSKPTVTAISPTSFGLSATITLTGTNLTNATQVSIGSGSGTNYCVVSAATGTSLTCTFGSNVPGMNQLTVKNLRALEAWNWGQGPTYTWTGGTSSPSGPSGPSGPQTSCTLGAPTSSNTAVTFDTSFGSGGSLSMGDSSNSVGPATGTVTRSGQILVAATASLTASPFTGSVRLVRYNVDGSLDTSFGTNGIGGFDVPAMQNFGPSIIAEQSDGSIMVTGTLNVFGASSSLSAVVMKFSSNGSPVTSFGTNGILTLDSASSPGFVYPAQMISVGDSVLVMYIRGSSGSTSTTKIVKIYSTGSLDSSFGTSGTLTLSGSGADLSEGPSGTLFVAGASSATTPDATVTKYTATGSLDTSFGTSGVATVDTSTLSERAVSASVVGGKVLVAVNVVTSASGQAPSSAAKLVRLNADGSVDSGYGTSGVATVYSGTMALVRAEFTGNGTGILTLIQTGQSRSTAVALVAPDGTPLAGSGTTLIDATAGACVASQFDLLPVGSSVLLIATNYPAGAGANPRSWIMKASVANVDLAAGGSTPAADTPSTPATPAADTPSTPATTAAVPTLVTSANAAALVRAPGAQAIIINGEEVVIESNTVNIPAARTPAAQRTAAQVASIQQAGAALLQQFLASLPAGATSTVTVVNTATGAVMQNLVFDANGN